MVDGMTTRLPVASRARTASDKIGEPVQAREALSYLRDVRHKGVGGPNL